MCSHPNVRYMHELQHPETHQTVEVGRVCAEKLIDDYVNPDAREAAPTLLTSSLFAAVVIGHLEPDDRSELAAGHPAGLDSETHRATLATVAAGVHAAAITAPIAGTLT
jgi:hypothetical protein